MRSSTFRAQTRPPHSTSNFGPNPSHRRGIAMVRRTETKKPRRPVQVRIDGAGTEKRPNDRSRCFGRPECFAREVYTARPTTGVYVDSKGDVNSPESNFFGIFDKFAELFLSSDFAHRKAVRSRSRKCGKLVVMCLSRAFVDLETWFLANIEARVAFFEILHASERPAVCGAITMTDEEDSSFES